MKSPTRPIRQGAGDRLQKAKRDIRSLGIGAPLRAGYELSKRAGGHALLFGRLIGSSTDPPLVHTPFVARAVPASVAERTVAAAARIVDGSIELFGQECRLGDPPNWHTLIHADGDWLDTEWWRIDLRSEERPGDVKWVWELGRHRHLVVLARAVCLDPSDPRFANTLNRHLVSWLEFNPPERGVHWYSNLEISLRAIAWLQILALAGDRLDPAVRTGMARHLHHAARHIIADLPYTVSTMRNNHLLADALGLVALGIARGGTAGQRWEVIGDRLFSQQLSRHMRPDGSMIEDSLSYHRFVLEMLAMRVVLGGASATVTESMRSAAQFLARLGVLDGHVPQYGDWDEGRVFAVADDSSDLTGSVRLALSLAGEGALDAWRDQHDEVAWFSDVGVPESPEPAEKSGKDIGAGIARGSRGPFTVWLKGGSGPSHGHADLSSVAIAHNDRWLVGDPGTGSYNGPIAIRNYFRQSSAHNVTRIDGIDQLEAHRAFRWVHSAQGTIGEPIVWEGWLIMWAVHDAYSRLSPSRRIARVVTLSPDTIDVVDHVEGPPVRLSLDLTLHPAVRWSQSESAIEIGDERFSLEVPVSGANPVIGEEDPYAGWWSDTYGRVVPTMVLQHGVESSSALRWSLRGPLETHSAEPPDNNPPKISVRFAANATRLQVDVGHQVFLRSI